MQNTKLIPASVVHAEILQTWFKDVTTLLTWGGPGLELTSDSEVFARQIKLQDLSSYALVDGDELLAFGQFYVRLGRHHFGRLAVSPQHRGKRLAYLLLSELADKAQQLQVAQGFSLFVFESNDAAIRTYNNCGFRVQTYPETIPGGLSNCAYMTAETLAIPLN